MMETSECEDFHAHAFLEPMWAGQFDSFEDWTRLKSRVIDPRQFGQQPVYIDARGRVCRIARDFERARDDRAFPVRYFFGFGPRGYARMNDPLWPFRETVADRRSTRDVIFERARQERFNGWKAEGFSADHDDGHVKGELVSAAFTYLTAYLMEMVNPTAGKDPLQGWFDYQIIDSNWPWDRAWFKPSNMRRRLVKALALGLAELDRLDRAEARAKAERGEHG